MLVHQSCNVRTVLMNKLEGSLTVGVIKDRARAMYWVATTV